MLPKLYFKRYLDNKVLLLFCTACLIRAIYVVIVYTIKGTSNWVDGWGYISFAENILSQNIFVLNVDLLRPNAPDLPGYPLLLAPLLYIFSNTYLPVLLLNALLSSIIPVMVYLTAKYFLTERYALAASWWSVFYVYYIFYSAQPLKEVLACLLIITVVYLTIAECNTEKPGWQLMRLGFLYTFLIHTDERYFVYFPIVCACLLLAGSGNAIIKLKKSLGFICIVLLLMVPWAIRNYIVYGRIIILTPRTTVITDKLFYGRNISYQSRKYDLMKEFRLTEAQADSIQRGLSLGVKVNKKYLRAIKQGAKYGKIPYNYAPLKRLFEEFKEFWRPVRFWPGYVYNGYRFEKPWSLIHNLGSGITYGLLLPLFIAGVFYSVKLFDRPWLVMLGIIVFQMVIHLFIAIVRNRYRIPIDSVIILFSMYGLKNIISQMKLR